ncbi:MAG: hypothetical protein MR208_01045, partial [Oscillospiraceae bacterium]|nr:hypothetical protein [Oscillospiraceae bacterium]
MEYPQRKNVCLLYPLPFLLYNSDNNIRIGMRKKEFIMELRTVTAGYFSPTDTTKKTVEAIAR